MSDDSSSTQPTGTSPEGKPIPRGLVIRRYRTSDEQSVRDICYDTGFLGKPASGWVDANRELFTDFWLRYHFVKAPEWAWVAEQDGRVVGYVVASPDTARRDRYMRAQFPWYALRSFLSGRYRMGRRTVGVLLRFVGDALRHGFPRVPRRGRRPSFHYNVRADYQGSHLACGYKLLKPLYRQLRAVGLDTCYGTFILAEDEIHRRYRHMAVLYDVRPTTVFRAVDPRPLYIVTRSSEMDRDSPAYVKRYGGEVEDPEALPNVIRGLSPRRGAAARLAFAGTMAGATAAAAMAPDLPIRLAGVCVPLLFAALFVGSRWRPWSWVGLFVALWLAIAGLMEPGLAQGCGVAALMGAAAGLVLLLPSVLRGMRTADARWRHLDAGVGGGVLAVAAFCGLTWFLRGSAGFHPEGVGFILLCGIVCYLAARGLVFAGAGDLGRRSVLCGTAIVSVAFLGTAGTLAVCRARAARWAERKAIAEAARWAEREQRFAEGLRIPGAITAALRRQALLARAAGDERAWLARMREAAARDPRDIETHRDLLRAGVSGKIPDAEFLSHFAALPPAAIAKADAEAALAAGLRTRDWAAFTKAWPLCGESPPWDAADIAEWLVAAKALYFLGQFEPARAILLRVHGVGMADWEAVRMLVEMEGRARRADGIRRILETPLAISHKVETLYLQSVAAKQEGRSGEERRLLREIGKLDPRHYGARRRLCELGEKGDGDPLLRVDGVDFAAGLRLLACKVDGSPAQRGENLRIGFVWEARSAVADCTVFVHVRQDVYGGMMFQGDHRFGGFGIRAAEWPVGETRSYTLEVPVPRGVRPGTYRVVVGLWDGRANRRAAGPTASGSPLRVLGGNRVLVTGALRVR